MKQTAVFPGRYIQGEETLATLAEEVQQLGGARALIVDTRVIAEAPVRFLVAGMGDALATWFEAESCRLGYAPNECGGVGTLAGYALARLCYETILEYGVAARMSCQEKVVPSIGGCRCRCPEDGRQVRAQPI